MLVERISKNREEFINGRINYVPFSNMGQFSEIFPGAMRGEMTGWTGAPAASKTSLIKHLLVHQSITWAIQNNKNLHVIYFGLEESYMQFVYSLLSYQAFIKYGLQYNIKDFEAIGRTVEVKDIPILEKAEKRVDKMLEYITYECTTYNSIGVWKFVRNFAQKRGKFLKDGKVVDPTEGWDKYVPNDPDEFVIVVFDHLMRLTKQRDEDKLFDAIQNTVHYLANYAVNKLNYSVHIVHHQNAELERMEAKKTMQILPTEAGLAVNQQVARDYLNLVGIANPNKVNSSSARPVIGVWDNHNLTEWKNYLRVLNVLKSRYGTADVNTPVFFAGRTGYFSGIPTGDEYPTFVKNLRNYK